MIQATKKYISLGKTIIESFYFMHQLTRNFGPPVHWTSAQVQSFFHDLSNNHLMVNRFAIAMDATSNMPLFMMNVDRYLDLAGEFSVEKYFRSIHLDYMEDYLKWAQSIYLYAFHMKHVLEPMQQSFRLAVPLRILGTGYHWVLMEAFPLQLDAEHNMVSHINIYTPLRSFDSREKIPIIGDLWDRHQRQGF